MRARFTQYSVPGWGVGEVWTRDRVLLAHEFDFRTVSDTAPPSAEDPLAGRFQAFFRGEDVSFEDVEIAQESATPFQRAVTEALRSTGRGEVVSYGELAALAGYPGAARAAGTFCAHNRFMLVVPCHRVVGATGLGSYGSAGLQTKRRLLALEGVEL